MFTRHAMTSTLALACVLTAPAQAWAQQPEAPAPLAVGVLSRSVDTHPARDAIYAVLTQSPNVDARGNLSVDAAYRATFGPRPDVALPDEPEDSAALMSKGSLEGLLVLNNVDGVLVVTSLGPNGHVLGVTRHDDLTPDAASARAIVRAAFDRIGPVTLAWRELHAPRGAERAAAPSTAVAPVDWPDTGLDEPARPAEPTRSAALIFTPPGGGPGAGVSDSTVRTPRRDDAPWTFAGGVMASFIEIDSTNPGLLLGAEFEAARASSGGWNDDPGLAFGLTVTPTQADVTLVRADMRAHTAVSDGATVSPELVLGGHAQWRDTPQTRGFFSFGPLVGGGLGVHGGLGTLRFHVTGGLDVSPGYGLGLVWDARLQADIPLGEGFILSPRSVRRASVLVFMERPATTMITWENDILLGVQF